MPIKILELLSHFRPLFTREATFLWFTIVIFGFLLRFDHYGVSSFIRWLHLPSTTYPLIIHFFNSKSWSLCEIILSWMNFCQTNFNLLSFNERLVIIGDSIKVPKESHNQPGIKYLRSPSQNQNKPQRFLGHHFGCVAFIAQISNQYISSALHKCKAILQMAQIHEGVDISDYDDKNDKPKTIVSRMMLLIKNIAISQKKPLYAVLDAFYSTSVAFHYVFHYVNESGKPWVHLITRAKSNYVAYTKAKKSKKNYVKLWNIFDKFYLFSKSTHPLHPEKIIYYYSNDLYWSNTMFFIRFVWVIDGGKKFILMSSDINLSPMKILEFYALRFKIELSFRVLKHIIGGLSYRFWSSLCEINNEKGSVVELEKQVSINEKILSKLSSIERYVNLAIIAQGILSYFSLMQTQWVWRVHHLSSWLRSYSSTLPSEEVVQRALQSFYITSFSFDEIKVWIKINLQPKSNTKQEKVYENRTLRHFLLS